MERIYTLVGKVVCEFQKLEDSLFLIVFDFLYKKGVLQSSLKFQNKDFQSLIVYSEKTLGFKLNHIKTLKIFQDNNDIDVLEFLKNKRNYIIHHFFLDNKFKSEEEIEMAEIELQQLFSDIKLILKALKNILLKSNSF